MAKKTINQGAEEFINGKCHTIKECNAWLAVLKNEGLIQRILFIRDGSCLISENDIVINAQSKPVTIPENTDDTFTGKSIKMSRGYLQYGHEE